MIGEENNMKKILSLVLTSVLVMTMFAGCSSKTDNKGNNDSAEEKVTLTIWGDTDNQALLESSFNKINEAFEEKYPNIKLDYQYSGTFDTINIAVQSNSLPDLFWVQGNKSTKMAELARNGYILPLDDYNLDASRFPSASVEYATVDGSIYCSYPSFFDYAVLYYNKEIFDKYGLDKPATWDEFVTTLDTLAQNGETPISFGGKGDFDRYWLMQVMAPALFNDTLTALKDKGTPDYAPMEKAFDLYREFAEKQYLGKDFASVDGVGAQLAFTNGKAAMLIDGTWNNQLYKEVGFEVGRFAIPSNDGTRYAQSGPSNYNTYAVAKSTKHADEAVKYIEFLNSKESQQIIEDELGTIPLVKDITPKDETVGELADYDVVGANIYHVLSGVADENGKPQDLLLGEVLPKLMMSEITGAEGVQIIKDEIAKVKAQ
jgi:raffinose/stachyose/melibiose transport system substrate-binding protein